VGVRLEKPDHRRIAERRGGSVVNDIGGFADKIDTYVSLLV
jgi:hypothetical protein